MSLNWNWESLSLSLCRDFLSGLSDDSILLLLNEAVGQLAVSSDSEVGAASVRLIILMANQLDLRLQPLLLSFRGQRSHMLIYSSYQWVETDTLQHVRLKGQKSLSLGLCRSGQPAGQRLEGTGLWPGCGPTDCTHPIWQRPDKSLTGLSLSDMSQCPFLINPWRMS